MSNIQIRIDKAEKEAAKKIFDKLGIDMSTAIKLFLRQTTLRKGLPFLVTTENGFTQEEEDKILRAASEAEKGINVSKKYKDDEAIEYLKSL